MFERIRNLLGRYGAPGLLRLCLRRAAARLSAAIRPELLSDGRSIRRGLRELLERDCDLVLLRRSGFGYRTALFQRPQQIARQMARQRALVLYEADPLLDRVALWREEEPGLILVNLRCRALRRLLLRAVERTDRPRVLQIYSTDRDLRLRELKAFQRRGWTVLYEYVDALSPAISGTKKLPRRIRDRFDYVMAQPEIFVAATADLLYDEVLRRRGGRRLIFSPNGVDCAFFREWGPFSPDPVFREILARGKPLLLYYGALASWLDTELLEAVAAAGLGSLVLIGAVYDASFDRARLAAAGIDVLRPKDYRVLKYYAREADVLLLPFRVDALTRAASPVKLFEYLALRKPIVSTDLDEARKVRGVLIGADHEDFLRKLRLALRLRGDPYYLELLDTEAQRSDWSLRAKAILDGLQMKKPPT